MTTHSKNVYSDDITTPTFKANFPVLFTTKEDLNGNQKYSVVMIFDKDEDLSNIAEAIEDVIAKKWGDKVPKELRRPFRDGDESKHDVYNNTLYATASAYPEYAPKIVDQNMEVILDSSKIYSGCFLRASITAVTYDKAGNAGVRFMLKAVQKVEDGDPISGTGVNIEDAFEPIKVVKNINNSNLLG